MTPCDAQVSPGRSVLFLTAEGMRSLPLQVSVEAEREVSVSGTLEPRLGTLLAGAVERDALVEVDGRVVGVAPVVVQVPVGERKLRFTKPGYAPVEMDVVVTEGEEAPP